MLAKGVPLKLLWAEIAGKVTGTCKGKGGPMHITHPGERRDGDDRHRRQLACRSPTASRWLRRFAARSA